MNNGDCGVSALTAGTGDDQALLRQRIRTLKRKEQT